MVLLVILIVVVALIVVAVPIGMVAVLGRFAQIAVGIEQDERERELWV